MTTLARHLLSGKASAEHRKTRWLILPLHYAYLFLLVAGLIETFSLGGENDQDDEVG